MDVAGGVGASAVAEGEPAALEWPRNSSPTASVGVPVLRAGPGWRGGGREGAVAADGFLGVAGLVAHRGRYVRSRPSTKWAMRRGMPSRMASGGGDPSEVVGREKARGLPVCAGDVRRRRGRGSAGRRTPSRGDGSVLKATGPRWNSRGMGGGSRLWLVVCLRRWLGGRSCPGRGGGTAAMMWSRTSASWGLMTREPLLRRLWDGVMGQQRDELAWSGKGGEWTRPVVGELGESLHLDAGLP